MAITNEMAQQMLAEVQRKRRLREWLTICGFTVLLTGVGGTFGLWIAMQCGGGIVFAIGLYGLGRK